MFDKQETFDERTELRIVSVDINRGAAVVYLQAIIGLSFGVVLGTLLVLFESSKF